MTKQQQKQVKMIEAYIANGMNDTAARSISALIRAALRAKDQDELRAFAAAHNLTAYPEFIA
jgi:uncharacterized protein YoaH (UPF0181 family)